MRTLKLSVALATLLFAGSSAASGIPVVDVAAISQSAMNQVESIAKAVQQIAELKNQLKQMKQQYEAVTGSRGLGSLANNPALRNYLPDGWAQVYDSVNRGGYSGLTGSARSIHDANQRYDNCTTTDASARSLCERRAAKAAQDKAFALEAFDKASQRWDSISQLIGAINGTEDPKAIAELQARIDAETAAIQNEQTKLEMYKMVAAAEDRLIDEQARQDQSAWSNRSGGFVFGTAPGVE